MANILVFSRDDTRHERLKNLIENQGYVYRGLENQGELTTSATQYQPDVFIVDMTDHPEDPIRFCQELRRSPSVIDKPILLITESINAAKAAAFLDAGADDLLRNPFEERELIARIRALLRFKINTTSLRLVEQQNTVYVDQRRVALTPVEFQLLSFLCNNRNRYYTANELLSVLWDYPPETGDTALVRNHIRNLRRKLEQDPDHPQVLVSRYGHGYSVRAVVQSA